MFIDDDAELLARWPHLRRLAPSALAWAERTLDAQLALPPFARHGALIDHLTRVLMEHDDAARASTEAHGADKHGQAAPAAGRVP